MIKRILLATDFSACSQRAADHALRMAHTLGAELIVAHAAEVPAGMEPGTLLHPDPQGAAVPVSEYIGRSAAGLMAPLLAACERAGVRVSAVVQLGPIVPALLEAAHAREADLIVVGTHGRTGLSRLLLGSVAERLLRLSPVPVLTVRGDDEEATPAAEEQARAESEG